MKDIRFILGLFAALLLFCLFFFFGVAKAEALRTMQKDLDVACSLYGLEAVETDEQILLGDDLIALDISPPADQYTVEIVSHGGIRTGAELGNLNIEGINLLSVDVTDPDSYLVRDNVIEGGIVLLSLSLDEEKYAALPLSLVEGDDRLELGQLV